MKKNNRLIAGVVFTMLLGLALVLGLPDSAYAAGSSSAGAEKIELDTWYIDEINTQDTEWFKFTTSGNKDSQYIMLLYRLPGSDEDEDTEYYISAATKLPIDEFYWYQDWSNIMLKLEANKTYRIRIRGSISYDAEDEDGDYTTFHKEGSLRYKIMIKEVKSDAAYVKASTSSTKPVSLAINKWYKTTTAFDYDSTNKNYFKFKTSARKNSRYVTLIIGQDYFVDLNAYCTSKLIRSCHFRKPLHAYDWWVDTKPISRNASATTKLLVKNKRLTGRTGKEIRNTKSIKYKLFILEMPDLPNKQEIKSLSAGKNCFTVGFKANSLVSRYQIAYRLAGSDKWELTTCTATKKTVTKLTTHETYQVKVRTQRLVNGKYHSGQWSDTEEITIK